MTITAYFALEAPIEVQVGTHVRGYVQVDNSGDTDVRVTSIDPFAAAEENGVQHVPVAMGGFIVGPMNDYGLVPAGGTAIFPTSVVPNAPTMGEDSQTFAVGAVVRTNDGGSVVTGPNVIEGERIP